MLKKNNGKKFCPPTVPIFLLDISGNKQLYICLINVSSVHATMMPVIIRIIYNHGRGINYRLHKCTDAALLVKFIYKMFNN